MNARPIRSVNDLRGVLRERIRQLGATFETIDDIAGLPTRYTAKLLGDAPLKNIGMISFDALLGATGLMLVPAEDPDALSRVQTRMQRRVRDSTAASRRPIVIKITKTFMRKIGAMGGRKSGEKRRAAAERKRALSERNRAKALKRWRAPKVTEIKSPRRTVNT